MRSRGNWSLLGGPLVAAGISAALVLSGQTAAAAWTAGVTCLCAAWWIFEPIPIAATSLIPFAVFPLAGVLKHTEAASAYGHYIVLMLIGGFMISVAMEKSGAHRRLALGMVAAVGGRGGRRLVLGFMIATAVLSMWISNTAAVLMMLPVALAALDQAGERRSLGVPMMLGLAYASHVGGLGTPIGTPPNMIFMASYPEATGQDFAFLDWMRLGVPMMLVLFPVVWLWLTRRLGPSVCIELPPKEPWRTEERRVLAIFFLTALAWITRKEPLGGWSGLLGTPGVGDDTVALLAALAMFVLPNGHGERLLDWKTAVKIPWDLLLLVGGGVAIARAFEVSGFSHSLAQHLAGAADWPPLVTVSLVCLGVSLLTECMSNTATAVLVLPPLAAAARAAGVDPILFMLPATFSCSCSAMLPTAAPPNAAVYGSGLVTTAEMAREGLFLKLFATVLITLTTYFLLWR
ncbi:MAG: SLC13/DASS family transporter [Candidatus Anammoximicrobium sp.]|nr:SLC13/DASS family transporter [Candidatus Anammoximicrobium sp.]